MLTPLDDSEHLLSREDFAAAVEAKLSEHPDIELISRSPQDIELRVRGLGVRAEREPFYKAYTRKPEQIDAILDRVIRSARKFVPDRGVSDYLALKERIFPMIKPVSMLAEVRERKLPLLAYQILLEDLIVTYVISEPQSVVYITEEHLERWELNESELHAQALANLRQLTDEERDYKTIGSGAQRLFFWETQDGYDASRLLLTDTLAAWQAQLPGQIVIGIPNRDFLIAFSDTDRTILEGIAQQVQRDSIQQDHGLTDKLFTLQGGTIREYEWD
jgi:uncharacterized protein YtpQ (UPF0354 family)